jgi:hypothetical protein
MEIRDLGRIRQSGVSRPEPNEAVPLGNRIRADAGRRVDGLLRRHVGASARGIEDQAVIAADHLIAFEASHGKRQQPMPAGILQGCYLPIRAAIENDVLIADRSGYELMLNFIAPSSGIPSVERKGFGVRHLFSPSKQVVYRHDVDATILEDNACISRECSR